MHANTVEQERESFTTQSRSGSRCIQRIYAEVFTTGSRPHTPPRCAAARCPAIAGGLCDMHSVRPWRDPVTNMAPFMPFRVILVIV